MSKKEKSIDLFFTVIMTAVSVIYVYPIFAIFINSLKKESAIGTNTVFKMPDTQTFAGLANYSDAVSAKGFIPAFLLSVFITVTSVAALLVFCSMCAWYIVRVNNRLTKLIYGLFVFSMIVPFQLVMFSLSQTADRLFLNSPWTIWLVYLGFGAGLAVFMFAGFIRSVPIDVEEAAVIDGCSPIQTYFLVVFPMLKPTLISVGILQTMWIWNDYLLPTLVLDIKKYKTVPMLIQYFRGSYGSVQMGPMMACIMLTVLPAAVFYLVLQKYIVKGIAAGAVKG
ncbi:MAG: carbohydrate ABC transporter permease [Firmicutes bacterium]|nr:carbohydrate ABC transporter permease [Bacillota bacterium]